jgi:hypothetical protein
MIGTDAKAAIAPNAKPPWLLSMDTSGSKNSGTKNKAANRCMRLIDLLRASMTIKTTPHQKGREAKIRPVMVLHLVTIKPRESLIDLDSTAYRKALRTISIAVGEKTGMFETRNALARPSSLHQNPSIKGQLLQ